MTRTTTFSVAAQDIITATLRKLEVVMEDETPSNSDYTNCMFGLNVMIKAWEMDGKYLWKTSMLAVPLLTNQIQYQIGPTATGAGAVVTDRPIAVIDSSYVRDTTNPSAEFDVSLTIITKQEYNQLGLKSSASITNQVYYDPQLYNGILNVYAAPSDNNHVAYLTVQTPVYDFVNLTDSADFPQEGYQALVYGLCEEMMDEYPGLPPQKEQRIIQKAEMFRSKLADFSQEEGSVFFMPSPALRVR